MFKNDIFWFVLLLTFFTAVLGKRVPGVRLARKCVGPKSSPNGKLPVIMLHGLPSTKETWNGIYQAIRHHTGRRVCIYDARNQGDSEWTDSITLDVLVEDLENFMADMKIPKASLVGHSMGGLTIMKFAVKNRNKVESLFVEDFSPIRKANTPNTDEAAIAFVRMLQSSLSAVPACADEETAKMAIIDYIANVTNSPPQSPDQLKTFPLHYKDGKWQFKTDMEAVIRAFMDIDSLLGPSLEGLYTGRSFFIYGEASPFKVYDDKEKILQIFPNAKFFGVKGAGHDIHTQHTAIFLRKLIKFLNQ